jgi:hypothetical protein
MKINYMLSFPSSSIKDRLPIFLSKKGGLEMVRTTVSRAIRMHLRANNLENAANGRQIDFNLELKTLFKVEDIVINNHQELN